MDVAAVTTNYLLYVVLPLWLVVGMADWLCHRAAHIETTSGVKESLIHLLMLGEVGIGVLLGLFFEINALVIAVMLLCFIAHEITAHWDLRYAAARRTITAIEQHVHNYLGALPFMGLSFIIVLHWPQALALLGLGPQLADFSVRMKSALPMAYVVTLIVLIALLEVLPYLEEVWRGVAAKRDHLEPHRRHAG
jgi:hypothetical protein